MEYCNSINSKKRNDKDKHDYQLNEKQFQILLKILNELKNDSKGVDQLVYSHTTTTPQQSSGLNKFDCSILLIIHNNTIYLKQQQQQQQQQLNYFNNNVYHPLKKMKHYHHQQQEKQILIKNKNDIFNDNNYLLFKKVWNILIIRNEIKLHLKLFNLHSECLKFDFEKFCNYKYKSYLRAVEIDNGLSIFKSEYCNLIPPSLEELCLLSIHSFEDNSIPTTIKKLVLGNGFNQKLTNNLYFNNGIDNNITELVFGDNFNQSLSECVNYNNEQQPWLPHNLTSLSFGSSFQEVIYPGQLPNSLTILRFDKYFKGTIVPNSIPKSVTTLNYTFNSNENDLIPSSITNLKYDGYFKKEIKVGDIPHNVTSLTFGCSFNNNIVPKTFPQSLRSLKFGFDFNKSIAHDILQSNLTSLTFGSSFDQPFTIRNNRIFIPHSLTYLCFDGGLNQTVGVNTFAMFRNLKTLIFKKDIHNVNGIIEPFSLPNSITTLDLRGYNGPIDVNRLPTSLTSLSLKYNNHLTTILPNTLPQSITTLYIYGIAKQPIHSSITSNLIPPNLKSIYFYSHYEHDLSSIVWPQSLESIYIPFDSYTITTLPTHFINKYIKIIYLK